MKAITLHQPWASWVAWGWKTVETRTHDRFRCLEGQRIAIHASLRWDPMAYANSMDILEHRKLHYSANQLALAESKHQYVFGAVLCTCIVRAHHDYDEADEMEGLIHRDSDPMWGLWLRGVRQFNPPITAKGHQGIWNWEPTP